MLLICLVYIICLFFSCLFGNSLDKLRHPRSDTYSAEQLLLNKQQISGGGACLHCNRLLICSLFNTFVYGICIYFMNIKLATGK